MTYQIDMINYRSKKLRRKQAPRKGKRVQEAERRKKIMVRLSRAQVVIAQIMSPTDHKKTMLVELRAVNQRDLRL